ncbi:hypothetical protein GXW82_04070 [Streptacidiphilus sp. 4-A2]|nr:hypothetical protein [Streptacidiphilus sp. 4-A2]
MAIDRLLGVPNLATLLVYTSVAICLTCFVALLVSWLDGQDQVRLRHRLLVGYSVTTMVMAVCFFLAMSAARSTRSTSTCTSSMCVHRGLPAVVPTAVHGQHDRAGAAVLALREGGRRALAAARLRLVTVGRGSAWAMPCPRWSTCSGTSSAPPRCTMSAAWSLPCRPVSPRPFSPSVSPCLPGARG